MRRLTTYLAFAVVAAVIVSAAAGAGTASAAQLCKVSTSPCPAGKEYPVNSHFSVTGEFGLSSITGCEFTYKFETTSASGSPISAILNAFVLTRCGTGYIVKAVNLNYSFPISISGGGPNGSAKMLGILEKGQPGFEVNGGGQSGCIYTAVSIPQTITGGGLIWNTGVALLHTGGTVGCLSGTSLSMGGFATPEFFITN